MFETDNLTTLKCWCGIKHAVPASLRDEQMRQHDNGLAQVLGIYCPLGHTHVPSGETKVSKLRKQLVAKQSHLEGVQAELEHTEARRRSTKAAHTRTKNRVAAGVCPCCRRNFVNLGRHMKHQHPDYQETEA